MNILLVGGGGREHALAWSIAQSPQCTTLYCAPGNAGIARHATCIDIGAEDVDALVTFAQSNAIDLVVVGPEAPLVKGLADKLKENNINVFGPSQAAAELEGSKGFMKDLCAKHNIPTANYGRFNDLGDAIIFINQQSLPVVLKTDGLAAGKGVIIAETYEEAVQAAENMLSGESFGDAGTEIVIEEFLDGEELSYFALADGKTVLPFTSAQDHKRVFDGDKGPNTGGMGAYSPAHLMTPELEEKILNRIIQPTIEGMAHDGLPFTGILFAGIMVVNNEPYLIEYNIRFGDPECQTMIPRLNGDLLTILKAAATGTLESAKSELTFSNDPALCVVMATNGYPGSYPKNTPINNINDADKVDHVTIFHAGTKQDENGQIRSTGGRVLGVTAHAPNLQAAQAAAYEAVDTIEWSDGFCRRDIGWRALKAQKEEAA